jgi:hypothetical protein
VQFEQFSQVSHASRRFPLIGIVAVGFDVVLIDVDLLWSKFVSLFLVVTIGGVGDREGGVSTVQEGDRMRSTKQTKSLYSSGL